MQDTGSFQAKAVAVETHGAAEIVYAEGDEGDSVLHGESLKKK